MPPVVSALCQRRPAKRQNMLQVSWLSTLFGLPSAPRWLDLWAWKDVIDAATYPPRDLPSLRSFPLRPFSLLPHSNCLQQHSLLYHVSDFWLHQLPHLPWFSLSPAWPLDVPDSQLSSHYSPHDILVVQPGLFLSRCCPSWPFPSCADLYPSSADLFWKHGSFSWNCKHKYKNSPNEHMNPQISCKSKNCIQNNVISSQNKILSTNDTHTIKWIDIFKNQLNTDVLKGNHYDECKTLLQ